MNFTFVLVQNVVHPVGLFNPVGFVNPVGLVNVNNCKLSRSTNLALNFPKILNLYNIFQTPSHTCLQVLFCLHWFNVIFFLLVPNTFRLWMFCFQKLKWPKLFMWTLDKALISMWKFHGLLANQVIYNSKFSSLCSKL